MAEPTRDEPLVDRLQPSLLDRLTDDHPGAREESREKRILGFEQLRAIVIRDLEWLLNAKAPPRLTGIHAHPEVSRSVLGYGLSSFWDQARSSVNEKDLEKSIKKAICDFEPRIIKKSLQISFEKQKGAADPLTIFFELRGEIWAEPMPEPLFLRTKVDLRLERCNLLLS